MAAAFEDKTGRKPAGGFEPDPAGAKPGPEQASRQAAGAGGNERPLTGPAAKLYALEARLPGALRQRGVACAFLALAVLAGVFGIGGAKLAAWRSSTELLYVMPADRYSTSIVDELDAALSAAQSITDLCAARLGEEDAGVAAARQAIALRRDGLNDTGPAAAYRANLELQSAIGYLYNTVRHEIDPSDTAGQALQGQWSDFTSHQDRLSRSGYNAAVEEYNRAAGSFPANLIGALWGAGELERFG